MGEIRLGLDIGPTSVGWCLLEVDDDAGSGRILAAGSRIFPEGVDRTQQGGEKSKNQARRIARSMRRQIRRRRARRDALIRLFKEVGLLPTDQAALEALLAANPYPLRARAASEAISAHELGRVFLHLTKRRGFRSSRKGAAKQDKGMLAEISHLQRQIPDDQTLGQFLNDRLAGFDRRERIVEPTDKERAAGQLRDTVRNLHTRRSMYIEEFERIWEVQKPHHPAILTDELRTTLYNPASNDTWAVRGLIFGQRNMYWPKAAIGRCELNPKERRCPRAARIAQRFRILQEVNNLRIIDTRTGETSSLTPDQRSAAIESLCTKDRRTFDELRKACDLGDHIRFNLEAEDRKSLKGHETDTALRAALGKKRWKSIDEPLRDAIAEILITEDDPDRAAARLAELGLSAEECEAVVAVNLPEGYAAYGRTAITRLIPPLEQGLRMMGNDPRDSALHAAGFLRPDEREVRVCAFLPAAPALTNPIVRAGMTEVRKVVNTILRDLCDAPPQRGGLTGGRRPDRIHVELAREAKKSLEQRARIRKEQSDRRKAKAAADAEIIALNQRPTRDLREKYLLWIEQNRRCVYTGDPISVAQMLSDATEVDHILPRWQSLDNSMMNKILCFREDNEAKGDRTPRAWLEREQPDRWKRVLSLARNLLKPKFERFLRETAELDDFVARQLNDTAYISRSVAGYLKQLGIRVEIGRGGITSELGRAWGLHGILSEEGTKTRDDHRHHAVDAAVIALTDPRRLQQYARSRGRDVPPPWPTIRNDLASLIAGVIVSHRPLRKIRGELHDATFYGATQKREDAVSAETRPWAKEWIEAEGAAVRRKCVSDITKAAEFEKVRYKTIRGILEQHVRSRCGGEIPAELPKGIFAGANEPRMPSGVPIRRVRMVERSRFEPVSACRTHQLIRPGSNHHIVYARISGGRLVARVTNMKEAARRARSGQSIVQLPEEPTAEMACTLCLRDSFRLDEASQAKHKGLFIVQEITEKTKGGPIVRYRLHCDASMTAGRSPPELSVKQMSELGLHRVEVDAIGREA